MTANQDLYAAAQAAIETRRALVAAGTPGPWVENVLGSEGYDIRAENPDQPMRRLRVARCGYETWETDKANAHLIAAAVNAFAADTEALAAGVERHAPLEVSGRQACEWCSDGLLQRWPCPDALDALAALGVAPC